MSPTSLLNSRLAATTRRWRKSSIACIAWLLSGCAGHTGSVVADLDRYTVGIELEDVPFHSQVTDQCGPAALATMLNDTGVPVTPGELKKRIYIPDRHGSLQVELIATTRRFDRVPYEIDRDLGALVDELQAGRPVLVLQNLGVTLAPVWHYAVVVGYLPARQQFVLRSGERKRLLMSARSFARTWQRGEFWGMVALKAGELPANADADRYLRAIAAIESTSNFRTAIPAYRAAIERWPDNSLAWLGLGNALFAGGDLPEAGRAFRKILEFKSFDAVALNNLSQVYIGLGCRDDALTTINAALSGVDESSPVHAHLIATQGEALRSVPGSRCL